MIAFLAALQDAVYWFWLVVMAVFLLLELFSFSFFFFFWAMAALLMALLTFFVSDLSWTAQGFYFILFSVPCIYFWWRVGALWRRKITPSLLNVGGQRYVGRVFVLAEPIEQGCGRLQIGDSYWSIRGPDLPAGAKVKVSEVEGILLYVEEA